MVDVSNIQPGDELDLRVKVMGVEYPGYDGKLVVLVTDGAGGSSWIGLDIITAHHPKPKPLGVGDRVRAESGNIYEIVGPKRRWEATGHEEYALWSSDAGYSGIYATEVEKWERVS